MPTPVPAAAGRILGDQFVIAAHDLHDFSCQHAGAADRHPGLAFFFVERENDGVTFDENFARSILGEQFVNRIVKVQAEIGSGV